MTEMTAEQRRELQAVAERATTKFGAFMEDLPADERAVLAAMLQQLGGTGDTAGYFMGSMGWSLWAGGRSSGASGGLDAVNSIDWNKVYEALGAK